MTTQNNSQLPATISSIQQFSFFNPDQFATMQRVANMFANAELVPDMYRTDKVGEKKAVSNCIIAIDIANRIEANILMVMQNLVIIYGRPSWSSKFLIATVNTCGRFEPLKYKFKDLGEIKDYKYVEYETEWPVGKDGKKFKSTKRVEKVFSGPVRNLECLAYTCEKGKSEILEGPEVSVIMAIDEGWYMKNGSKWPNMTKLMLTYRAASFWTNTFAPELSMGMKTEEELRDIIDTEWEDVTGKDKVKEEINANANKKPIDIDEPKLEPLVQEAKTEADPKADSGQKVEDAVVSHPDVVSVKDWTEAKKFLIDMYEVSPEGLTSKEKVIEVAKANGFEFVIKKPEPPKPMF